MVAQDLCKDLVAHVTSEVGSSYALLGGEPTRSGIRYFIPTGCDALDILLGGGWPVGRIAEVFGKESSGKSTLLMTSMIACQRAGGVSVLIDSESSMFWNRKFVKDGFDPNSHINIEAKTVEAAFDSIRAILGKLLAQKSDVPMLIGWDTIAASTDEKEQSRRLSSEMKKDGTPKESNSGGITFKPRIIQMGFRQLVGMLSEANASLIVLNQVIANVSPYGAAETTPGGNALRHYPSLRLQMRKSGEVPEGGTETEIRVIKNKIHRQVAYKLKVPILPDEGIDNLLCSAAILAEGGGMRRKGGWLSFDDGPGKALGSFREKDIPRLVDGTPGLSEWILESMRKYLSAQV